MSATRPAVAACTPLRFGSLELDTNLFLSPLAGYTSLPFRIAIRELGGLGLATTDLVNARSLLERRTAALKLIETCDADRPVAVQLFGSVPEEMRDAAVYLEEIGVQSIDINMGCPVRKVCRVGGGSAMMAQIDQTVRLVQGMVKAVRIPVTAKMRLGWDDENITAPELARALENAGVAAVFVHGRTRAQGFSGRVNLEGIAAVVGAIKRIPVIGNGDITTPEAAKVMLEKAGCAGVSIGRGAFYDPWIFAHTREYLNTGKLLQEPRFEERVRFMCRHLELMISLFGEEHACKMFRKIGPWYARRFGPAKLFSKAVVQISTKAEFDEILAQYRDWRRQFLDENGELKERFKPAPLPSSFLEPATPAIAVPKGPVERW